MDSIIDMAVTPDGHRAVSGGGDRTLRLWDLESGETIRRLKGHMILVFAVAVTPDGRRAVSNSWDNMTLRLWDLESGQSLCALEGRQTRLAMGVATTLDGRRAVSVSDERMLQLWDLESGKEIATFTGESEMRSCAITSDGRTIVAGESSGRVHFLRLVEADETKPSPA